MIPSPVYAMIMECFFSSVYPVLITIVSEHSLSLGIFASGLLSDSWVEKFLFKDDIPRYKKPGKEERIIRPFLSLVLQYGRLIILQCVTLFSLLFCLGYMYSLHVILCFTQRSLKVLGRSWVFCIIVFTFLSFRYLQMLLNLTETKTELLWIGSPVTEVSGFPAVGFLFILPIMFVTSESLWLLSFLCTRIIM